MKRLLTLLILFTLLASPALAEDTSRVLTVGGATVGYAMDGPDDGRTFASYFAGVRVKGSGPLNVFTVLQQINIEGGPTGTGGKLIAQNEWRGAKGLSTLLDVGFATNMAVKSDGSKTTGITFGGGLAFEAGDVLGFLLYGTAVDRGPDFSWAINVGIFAIDPLSLIPGM